jgi:hypothetical protein
LQACRVALTEDVGSNRWNDAQRGEFAARAS